MKNNAFIMLFISFDEPWSIDWIES